MFGDPFGTLVDALTALRKGPVLQQEASKRAEEGALKQEPQNRQESNLESKPSPETSSSQRPNPPFDPFAVVSSRSYQISKPSVSVPVASSPKADGNKDQKFTNTQRNCKIGPICLVLIF